MGQLDRPPLGVDRISERERAGIDGRELRDEPADRSGRAVLVVAPERAAALETLLRGAGETVFRIGQIEAGEGVRYRGTLL